MRNPMPGILVVTLSLLAAGAASAVTAHVQVTTPAGEPLETGYVVLDEAGETVVEGRTDARGQDRQDLPPGAYVFRSGDGEERLTIREGQRAASVAVTRSPAGLASWGFDTGATWGYADQDGRLESGWGMPDAPRTSDALQLDGTGAGLYGRVRLPLEVLSGQPFVQIGGRVDTADGSDRVEDVQQSEPEHPVHPEDEEELSELEDAEEAHPQEFREIASLLLDYRAGLSVIGGMEWDLAVHGDHRVRLRPYGGLAFDWWSAELTYERSDLPMRLERLEEDFTTTSARLGMDVGVPLVACERLELDIVFGAHVDFPFGGDARDLEHAADSAPGVDGGLDLDESWGARAGLELRFRPFTY